MKNIIRISIFALAAAMSACSMQDNYESVEQEGTVKITLSAAAPETRTYFGEKEGDAYPTLWSENDKVYVSINAVGNSYGLSQNAVVSNGGKNAEFEVELTSPTAEEYYLYAYSPKDSYTNDNRVNTGGAYNTVDGGKIRLWIPKVQTPTATSVDPNAQLLFGKSAALTSLENKSVDMTFSHWTAYGKMTLTGLALDSGDAIKSVTLTAEGEHWLSGGYVHRSADGLVETTSSTKDLNLTVNTASASDIWFSCFAGVEGTNDLSDTKLTVVVATEKLATYTRVVDLTGKELAFKAGRISTFSVDMSSAEVEKPVTGKKLEAYVDFGSTNSDIPWNSYSAVKVGTTQTLKDVDGETTAVTIATTANFSEVFKAAQYPAITITSNGIEWASSAWEDAFLIKDSNNAADSKKAAITLAGLDPSKTYTVTVLSARYSSSTGARNTKFTLSGSETLTENILCNLPYDQNGTDAWATFDFDTLSQQFTLAPNAEGKIEIGVVGVLAKVSQGLLNALHIIENE